MLWQASVKAPEFKNASVKVLEPKMPVWRHLKLKTASVKAPKLDVASSKAPEPKNASVKTLELNNAFEKLPESLKVLKTHHIIKTTQSFHFQNKQMTIRALK